ncbi:hypothetical protein V3C99_003288 [Haemonchus contortus]
MTNHLHKIWRRYEVLKRVKCLHGAEVAYVNFLEKDIHYAGTPETKCNCECGVHQPPTDQSNTCTPSSSGASTPTYCATRRKICKGMRKQSRSRYLLAIEDRNRLRKLAARKIKLAANAVSALTLRRWEEKIDRKFEKKFEEQRVKVQQLKKDNEFLRANQRIFKQGCSVLESCAVVLQVKLEEDMDAANLSFPSPHDFYVPHI